MFLECRCYEVKDMPNAYSCDHQTLINFIYNYGKYFIYNYGILLMEDTHTCTERHDLFKKTR